MYLGSVGCICSQTPGSRPCAGHRPAVKDKTQARQRMPTRTLALALLGATLTAAPAYASPDSAIQAGCAVALPPGHEQYFYIAATSGEQPLQAISWLEDQDLAVEDLATDEQAISIGHGPQPAGSCRSSALAQASAAVGLDGYTITQVYTARAHRRAHRSGHQGRAVGGARLTLRFRTTEADQLVLILVGGQGAGSPELSGIKTTPLQEATYGPEASGNLASAAVYAVQLRSGKHKATWSTTAYIPNAGTTLGAVAYVLSPQSRGEP